MIGDVWLTYEQGGLHEDRPDLIQDVDVLMPRMADPDGYGFHVGAIQRYWDGDKQLWRSLTPMREIFRKGYTSRERCAQELVSDCAADKERILWRKRILSRKAS